MTNQPVKDKAFYLNSGNLYSDKVGHLNRRKDFREYLDRTGVLDKLTGIFMDLFEYPVLNFETVEYVRKSLIVPNPDEVKIAEIRTKLDDAISFRDYLKTENESLRAVLEKTAEHGGVSAKEED